MTKVNGWGNYPLTTRIQSKGGKPDYSACGFSPVHGDKIVVLEVYMDESGTHGAPLLITAGYVADVNDWASFSVEWNRILKDYNVAYFHAHEFRNGKSRVFRHLSPIDKRDLLGALIANIRKTVVMGLFSAVNPREYNELTTAQFRSRHGTAYTLCVRECLSLLYLFFPGPGEEDADVGIFLEEGHPNLEQLIELLKEDKEETDPVPLELRHKLRSGDGLLAPKEGYERDDLFGDKGLKIRSYGHGSKRGMPPLQAADLLAYCLYVDIASSGRDRLAGDTLSAMTKGIPHGAINFKRSRIEEIVEFLTRWDDRQKENNRRMASVIRELNAFGMYAKRTIHGLDVDLSNATEEGVRKFFPHLLEED